MGFDWGVFSNIFQSGAGALSNILPSVIGSGGNVTTLPVQTTQYYNPLTGAPITSQADGGFFDEYGDILLIAGGALALFLIFNSRK